MIRTRPRPPTHQRQSRRRGRRLGGAARRRSARSSTSSSIAGGHGSGDQGRRVVHPDRRQYGELVSWSPSSTFAARSHCSGGSRPSPASTSTSSAARSCCSAAPTAPARPPCCGSCAGLVPVAVRRGRRPRPRPARPTAPRGPLRVGLLGHGNRPLRRPDRRRQRPLLGPQPVGRRRRRDRRPPWTASAWPAAWPTCRVAPAVGRPAPPHRPRRPGRPPARAVAARRAPRRPRRRRPRPARRPARATPSAAGATVRVRLPRARPGRAPRPPHRHDRRRHRSGRRPRRPRDARTRRAGLGAVLRAAALVAGKDLRIEARSRVATNQVAPVRLLRPARCSPSPSTPTAASSPRAAPGLFWMAVLFSHACSAHPAGLRGRGGRRQPRRPAAVGPRPGRRSSSARPARRRAAARWCSRCCSASAWSSSTRTDVRATVASCSCVDRARRDRRAGRRRYALRRPRRRRCGCARRCSRSCCSRWWRRC